MAPLVADVPVRGDVRRGHPRVRQRLLGRQPEHLVQQRVRQRIPLGEQDGVVEVLALRVGVAHEPQQLPGQGQRGRGGQEHGPAGEFDRLGLLGEPLVEDEVELDVSGRQPRYLPGQHHPRPRRPLVRPDVLADHPGFLDPGPAGRAGRDLLQHPGRPPVVDVPAPRDDHEVQVAGLPGGVPEPVGEQHAPAQHQRVPPP